MTTGMVQPLAGKVTFADQDVTHWPMYMRARLGMGYLSQEQSIFRKLTVEQNVLAILEAMPKARSLGRRLTARERTERTDQVLDQFGLNRVRKNVAMTLSGGEKRRLEIARCLVCEPLLIMLDEPFTGIDPITISDIQQIVRNLRDTGIGMLLTDHNVREALKITDRSYVITDGEVVTHGSPEEIVRHPKVIGKYLGQSFADDNHIGGPVHGPAPAPAPQAVLPVAPPPPPVVVRHVLETERTRDLVELLKTDQRDAAERELLQAGRAAVPVLLEALERRDLEVRRMAFHVLQQLLGGAGAFDPYAPEAQRRQQIDRLREQALRKAG
jgi:lipopolysaccharide export system ATP-binding protein